MHVIPLCEGDLPLAYETHLAPILRATGRILYDRAQIRVHTTFHEPYRNPPENALRLGAEFDLILDEAWLKGTWHQMQTVKLLESNPSSLIALGHPIIVYVVREVGYNGPGKVVSASGGPIYRLDRSGARFSSRWWWPDPTTELEALPLSPYPPTVASSPGIPPRITKKYLNSRELYVFPRICHALA